MTGTLEAESSVFVSAPLVRQFHTALFPTSFRRANVVPEK